VEVDFRSSDGGSEWIGQWGFIDRRGHFKIRATFSEAQSFSEGLAGVRVKGGQWGYIDTRGVITIQPRFSQINAFSDGLALVWPNNEEGGYYIDKAGRKVLVTKLWPQWSFSDGLTVAGRQGERNYLNRKGEIIAPYEIDPGI
jgi:hypothetical protein